MIINMPSSVATYSHNLLSQYFALEDSQLRTTAHSIVFQMMKAIEDKKIDHRNLVFAIGEEHGITQINLFGLYMMEALKKNLGLA